MSGRVKLAGVSIVPLVVDTLIVVPGASELPFRSPTVTSNLLGLVLGQEANEIVEGILPTTAVLSDRTITTELRTLIVVSGARPPTEGHPGGMGFAVVAARSQARSTPLKNVSACV